MDRGGFGKRVTPTLQAWALRDRRKGDPTASVVGTKTRPSIVEDFDPPEAATVGHRGLAKSKTFICCGFRTARGNDGPPQRLEKTRPACVWNFDQAEATTVGNPRPSFFENFDPPEATKVCHRGLKIQDLQRSQIAEGNLPLAAQLPWTGDLFKMPDF